jgi:hypothetical protein
VVMSSSCSRHYFRSQFDSGLAEALIRDWHDSLPCLLNLVGRAELIHEPAGGGFLAPTQPMSSTGIVPMQGSNVAPGPALGATSPASAYFRGKQISREHRFVRRI